MRSMMDCRPAAAAALGRLAGDLPPVAATTGLGDLPPAAAATLATLAGALGAARGRPPEPTVRSMGLVRTARLGPLF
jgi:hypothetical protein